MLIARTALDFVRRAALAGTLAVVMPLALAQGGPPGHPGGGMPPLAAVLLDTTVHTGLALDATRESAWAALDAAEAALHTQMQASHETLKTLVATELARATPDLVLIETSRAIEHQALAPAMQSLATQAAAFYASLSDAQKAVVVAAVQSAYQRSLAGPRGH